VYRSACQRGNERDTNDVICHTNQQASCPRTLVLQDCDPTLITKQVLIWIHEMPVCLTDVLWHSNSSTLVLIWLHSDKYNKTNLLAHIHWVCDRAHTRFWNILSNTLLEHSVMFSDYAMCWTAENQMWFLVGTAELFCYDTVQTGSEAHSTCTQGMILATEAWLLSSTGRISCWVVHNAGYSEWHAYCPVYCLQKLHWLW